jgi:membrane protein DedA with SNARE-associated domain
MTDFFTYLEAHGSAILLLLLALIVFTIIVQWLAWILGKGRFGRETTAGSKALSIAVSEAIFKIINEFRHLLALLVFLVFAVALIYSLIKAASIPTFATNPADPSLTIPGTPSVVDNMKEALQAVVATLGGLVGSIIGYYFGESSGKSGQTTGTTPSATSGPSVQEPPPGDDIRPTEMPGNNPAG